MTVELWEPMCNPDAKKRASRLRTPLFVACFGDCSVGLQEWCMQSRVCPWREISHVRGELLSFGASKVIIMLSCAFFLLRIFFLVSSSSEIVSESGGVLFFFVCWSTQPALSVNL